MNNIKSLVSVTALISAAFAVGCGAEDVGTGDVKTNGFYAKYEAVASGPGHTVVRAELRVGGPNGTYGFLSNGDRLVASALEEGADDRLAEANMSEDPDSSGDRHWYVEEFDTDKDNTEFRIEFIRGDEDEVDALDSTVKIPKPFAIDIEGIDEDDEIVRGTDVTVTWSNEDGGNVNWSVEGDCIWSRDGTTSDDMEFTIPAEEIEVLRTDEGESCTVQVIIERTRKGKVDSAFGEGGEFWGIQRRGFEFTSTPAPGEGEGAGGAGGEGN